MEGVSREVSEAFKVWLLLGGVGLVAAWRFLPRRACIGLLAALTVVAGLNYGRWGLKVALWRVDDYDLIHYYLNAKYFDELGYYDLYPACLLADRENGGPWFKESGVVMHQDEAGHRLVPISYGVKRGREVKAEKFTPERWAAFSRDFVTLQRTPGAMTNRTWEELLNDHGFNGTTVWTTLARPIASVVPVEHVKLLGYLDVLLLAGAVGAIGWAYGAEAALWVAFFLFTGYSTRWPTLSWAFLRYDYVAALLFALAFVRKGKTFVGGLFAGYAAALRLFPAMWLFGPGAKGLAGLLERKVHKQLLVLLGGFCLGVTALQGVALLDLGVEPVRVHVENMTDHNSSEKLTSRRIGLALALPFDGKLLPKKLSEEVKRKIEVQKPVRFVVAGVVLLLLAWGLRRADDDETYAWGFLPFFLLTTASYYYYVVRAPLFAMHGARLREPRHAVGLASLLALELFSNWAETRYPEHRHFLIGYLAWGIFAYALVQAGWMLVSGRKTGSLPKGSSTTSDRDGASAPAGAAVASSP